MILNTSKTNTEIFGMDKMYGDGLFMFGGDIHCTYPLLSTEMGDDYVMFEYEPYSIKVSWENQDGKRVNPICEKIDKQGGN